LIALLLLWLKTTQHIDSFDTDPGQCQSASLYPDERQTGAAGGSSVNAFITPVAAVSPSLSTRLFQFQPLPWLLIFHPLLFLTSPSNIQM
jgi:hypothetical protein